MTKVLACVFFFFFLLSADKNRRQSDGCGWGFPARISKSIPDLCHSELSKAFLWLHGSAGLSAIVAEAKKKKIFCHWFSISL